MTDTDRGWRGTAADAAEGVFIKAEVLYLWK